MASSSHLPVRLSWDTFLGVLRVKRTVLPTFLEKLPHRLLGSAQGVLLLRVHGDSPWTWEWAWLETRGEAGTGTTRLVDLAFQPAFLP
jgi:hypothetical protein